MPLKKYKDWSGWLVGLRTNVLKAGATSLMTMLGSNAVAQLPGLGDVSLNWKGAVVQFLIHVVVAAASYVQAKPDADVVTEESGTGNASAILLPFLLAGSLLVGCGSFSEKRLEVGGAYAPAVTNVVSGEVTATAAPDMALFVIDSGYQRLYDATLTILRIEKNNRALLSQQFPDLKRQTDEVREAVWQIDGDWAAARQAYLTNPVPANLDALNRTLAEMQRWNAAASTLLPAQTK
jgi:hypothetical protein